MYDFDRLLASVLEDHGPQVVPETVVEAAIVKSRDVGQRRPRVPAFDGRAWPAGRLSPLVRLSPLESPVVRVLLLALVATAVVALAVVGSALLRKDPPIKGLESTFGRPFEYAIPVGSEMRVSGVPRSDMVAWVDGPDARTPSVTSTGPPYPWQVRGVVIGWGEGASSHGGDGRFMLRTVPADFLADLRDVAGSSMGAISETTLDGYPAMTVMLPGSGGSDIHLNGRLGGLGGHYVKVTLPSRLTVAEIDDTTIFVLEWARDDRELDAWLPVADEFVASIHFLP